jgi:2,3-diketo-5-methylthio-1-phosphopentane phosphatase
MVTSALLTEHGKTLISDFDGAMTRYDFFRLAIDKLLPPDTANYWADYRAGLVTHFEALRRYFAAIRASKCEVLEVIQQMEMDPEIVQAVESLREAGWNIIVTSAGCDWYIRWLLASVGLELEIHANPGRFEPGRGLIMEMPRGTPFPSPELGVDKAQVVLRHLLSGETVAFAGDGFPDVAAARMAPGNLRFARRDLADALRSEGLLFNPFSSWSDIAKALLDRNT